MIIDNGLSLADGTVGAKGSVTHKETELLDVCVEDDDDEDFTEYIRRPPKRFYIGGFTADVSTQKIFRYINKRGPTVTWIRAWPSSPAQNQFDLELWYKVFFFTDSCRLDIIIKDSG